MIYNGNKTTSYNDFTDMPKVPINIVKKIAKDNSPDAENLWKILRYDEMDALSKTNLTYQEKMALVWTPDKVDTSEENLFRVFLKPLIPSALDESVEQTQLRISRYMTKSIDRNDSLIVYQFLYTTSELMSMVLDEDEDLVERTDLIERYLLSLLNGCDLGVGVIEFVPRLSGIIQSTQNVNNSKSLYGRSLYMVLRYLNPAMGGGTCG